MNRRPHLKTIKTFNQPILLAHQTAVKLRLFVQLHIAVEHIETHKFGIFTVSDSDSHLHECFTEFKRTIFNLKHVCHETALLSAFLLRARTSASIRPEEQSLSGAEMFEEDRRDL